MIACLDVDYREAGGAVAACLLFSDWKDETAARELTRFVEVVEPYVPGQFYRRELPCLLAVLADLAEPLDMVVVDGYVWLGSTPERRHPGLGAHLYEALGGRIPVVGVAKTRFADADGVPVLRGDSQSPLFVTAEGFDPVVAAEQVRVMQGKFRVPTLLKRVDQLCRRAPHGG